MACSCCRNGANSGYQRPKLLQETVAVICGARTFDVRLAGLAAFLERGRRYVNLVDVWAAANVSLALDALRFDFTGDDGFGTAQKTNEPPPGALLREGYVDLETRDLRWRIDVPCFYRVKGLVVIVGHAPAA